MDEGPQKELARELRQNPGGQLLQAGRHVARTPSSDDTRGSNPTSRDAPAGGRMDSRTLIAESLAEAAESQLGNAFLEIESLRRNLAVAEVALAVAQRHHGEALAAAHAAEIAREDLARLSDGLRAENTRLRTELQLRQAELNGVQARFTEASNHADQALREVDARRAEAAELRLQTFDLQREIAAAKTALESRVAELTVERDDLVAERAAFLNRVHAREQSADAARARQAEQDVRLLQLQAAIDQEHARAEEAEAVVVALRSQLFPTETPAIETSTTRPADLRAEDIEAALAAREAAFVEAERQIAFLETKRAEGGQHVAALEAALRRTAEEIDRRQASLDEIRSSTTWLVARAFARAGSAFPAAGRKLFRRALSRMWRMRRGAVSSTHPASTPEINAKPAGAAGDVRVFSAAEHAKPAQFTVIVALEGQERLTAETASCLSAAGAGGAEIIVCTPADGSPGGLHVPFPPSGRLAEHVDMLIRGCASPVAFLLTRNAVIQPETFAAGVSALDVNPSRVAAWGPLTPDGAPVGGDYRARSVSESASLAPGLIAIDVDAYCLIGGLSPAASSLGEALDDFARRVRREGFSVVRNPFMPGRLIGDRAQPAAPVDISGKPRALIVDLATPAPDRDSGSVDMYWQLRILQDLGYDVTFLPVAERGHAGAYTDALRELGVLCVLEEDCGEPWTYLAAEGRSFSLIVLSRVGAACHLIDPARQFAPQAKIVFNTVDLHFVREERAARMAQSDAMLEAALATKREELRVISLADVTTVVSTYEQELLSELTPEARIAHVPIVRPVTGVAAAQDRQGVMFVGGFRHAPNVDAVQFLTAEIWPRVRAMAGDLKLYIIGSSPPPEILALTSEANGIEVAGHVPSMTPWYQRVRVNVAPLRYGGGIKGKIVGSLCAGLPSVATSVAIEGMQLKSGEDVLVADDAQAFAEEIVRLSTDDGLWKTLSHSAVAKARSTYSVEAVKDRFRSMLSELNLPYGA